MFDQDGENDTGMVKRETLAGVRVDDCSLREALQKVDEYLHNSSVSIVETVNMKTIVAAGEDEKIRSFLETMDLVVPSDREILMEMGTASEQRLNEVQDNLLLRETVKMIADGQFSLFLLTNTREQEEELTDYLAGECGEMFSVCGSYALGEGSGDAEDVVNEINSVAPHVILSALPTPEQELFICEHARMLNIKLWFGIGTENNIISTINSPGRVYRKLLARHKMKRQIQSYEAADKGELS